MVTVPSPQCVGREFVRQYYTLLNQEPVQIHRYYEFFIIISGGCRWYPFIHLGEERQSGVKFLVSGNNGNGEG